MSKTWIYDLRTSTNRVPRQATVEAFLAALQGYHGRSGDPVPEQRPSISPERFTFDALRGRFPGECARLLGASSTAESGEGSADRRITGHGGKAMSRIGVLGRALVQVLDDPQEALGYEVHPAIAASGAEGVLPAYVRRPHDEQLAAVIDRARAGTSAAVVLIGESSTGKTRACWEALAGLTLNAPGHVGWRLWHPLTVQDLLAGLTGSVHGAALGGWTVVWLNELQRYLLPASEETAQASATLRALLRDRDPVSGPVLILGTIWEDPYWATLSAVHAGREPDPLQQARALARQVTTITVPPVLGDDARQAACDAAAADSRWRVALREAPIRTIQYLAGSEYLRRRYEHATATRRAVLQAAGDARRVGAPAQLPLNFLTAAAGEYLSDEAWDLLPSSKRESTVWVREAIDGDPDDPDDVGLARGGLGVRGPLHAVRLDIGTTSGPAYELADYLEQLLRRELAATQPRDSLWNAAATFTNPAILNTMAYAAKARGRFQPAIHLHAAATACGDTSAWLALVRLRKQAWDWLGAEDAARQAIAYGNTEAWLALVELRDRAGDQAGAEDAARQAVAAGDGGKAWIELARARERVQDWPGAEEAARQAVAAGEGGKAWIVLACVRERAANRPGSEDAARQAVAAGDTGAWTDLVWLRESLGDRAAAEDAAGCATAVGDYHAWADLAMQREETGDRAGAEDAARQAAAAGVAAAWSRLAWLRERAWNLLGAEEAARQAIAARRRPRLGHARAAEGASGGSGRGRRRRPACGRRREPRCLVRAGCTARDGVWRSSRGGGCCPAGCSRRRR